MKLCFSYCGGVLLIWFEVLCYLLFSRVVKLWVRDESIAVFAPL